MYFYHKLRPTALKIANYLLNFGPQHPAAHGVLRLVIEFSGEQVKTCDPHIGLLHRGTEKLIEHKTILQALPYMDRLDYVSMMAQEHAYSLVVENLYLLQNPNAPKENGVSSLTIPKRASKIRILFVEITRILNHLLALTTHAMDIGALTPFLWAFEEREKLVEFYERVCGARMHAAFIRPGGVAFDIPKGILNDIYVFINAFEHKMHDIEDVLIGNRIFKERLVNVGIVDSNFLRDHSYTGVMTRGSGIPYDLRKNAVYENYNEYNFKIPVGSVGDCYDRFKIRIAEIRESISIILQVLDTIEEGPIKVNSKITNPLRNRAKYFMEDLIQHFKYFSNGIIMPEGSLYTAVEAPKGEFGIFLTERLSRFNKPWRCFIRSPGFFHLAGLNRLAQGTSLADVVAIIGTLDLVFGEIDR